MGPSRETPENGAFNIEMKGNWALVERYFAVGRTEIAFCAVVKEPRNQSIIGLHIASLKVVIAHLQEMLDLAQIEQQSDP